MTSPSQVEGELGKAEAKFRESLAIKPDYVDAFQMLADLQMQRAKLAARFHAPLPRCAMVLTPAFDFILTQIRDPEVRNGRPCCCANDLS